MSQPKPEKLERTPEGFRVRLRYGKGLRQRFLIRLQDEEEAQRRARALQDLASLMARTGHSAEAPIVLRKAAGCLSEKDFREAARITQDLCRAPVTSRLSKVTFGELAQRWTSGALAREFPDHVASKKTVDLDLARLKAIGDVQVAPGVRFDDLPLDSVGLDQAEIVMRSLPDSARRPATRRHYAQLIRRLLELAVFPCRVIKANPLPRGWLPKAGKPPAFPYLYPDEDAALLAKTEIPLGRRLLWGVLDREGPRSGEAVSFRIGVEVDLERGAIKLDANKTDDPRTWAMDQGVWRALRAYVKLRGASTGDFLFVDENGLPFENDKLAQQLRTDLKAAGVLRRELHEDGENTRAMRAHDLRGTFVTLSLANGLTETWVADRTGHKSSAMINRYRRAARSATELGLGPLLPLDEVIPELASDPKVGQKVGQPDPENDTERAVSSGYSTTSRSGGIGRRGGLKIRFQQWSVGSTPTFGTDSQLIEEGALDRPPSTKRRGLPSRRRNRVAARSAPGKTRRTR